MTDTTAAPAIGASATRASGSGASGTGASATAVSDADFRRFTEFFYRLTGIQFGDHKRYFVDKRLLACMAESGERDFGAWFARLRLGDDRDLTQRLVNRFTVNETYFGREDYQFAGLVQSLLPRVLADRGGRGPISILSLPCSTGEEAYSIAISVLEQWPDIASVDVSIVGADIDTGALAAARRGEYGRRALHLVPRGRREKYFEQIGEEQWRVARELRDAIDFVPVNLCDPAGVRHLRGFDVVFCRNLLIYFDQLSSRKAAEHLYGMLRPGGYLFLGHSESMSRISPIFDPVPLPEGLAYRRPPEVAR